MRMRASFGFQGAKNFRDFLEFVCTTWRLEAPCLPPGARPEQWVMCAYKRSAGLVV